jgi:transposase
MMSVEIFTIGHSPIAPHGAVIEDLTGDWRHLDERIKGPSNEIEAIARQDIGCERLMSVPGVGPIISSAMVAATGAGDSLLQGPGLRRMAGPRLRQMSIGDRTILRKIFRRGNRQADPRTLTARCLLSVERRTCPDRAAEV